MSFKVGDIVRLKSGGPIMTVVDFGKYGYDDTEKIKCVWFDGKKKYEDVFIEATLEKA